MSHSLLPLSPLSPFPEINPDDCTELEESLRWGSPKAASAGIRKGWLEAACAHLQQVTHGAADIPYVACDLQLQFGYGGGWDAWKVQNRI